MHALRCSVAVALLVVAGAAPGGSDEAAWVVTGRIAKVTRTYTFAQVYVSSTVTVNVAVTGRPRLIFTATCEHESLCVAALLGSCHKSAEAVGGGDIYTATYHCTDLQAGQCLTVTGTFTRVGNTVIPIAQRAHRAGGCRP